MAFSFPSRRSEQSKSRFARIFGRVKAFQARSNTNLGGTAGCKSSPLFWGGLFLLFYLGSVAMMKNHDNMFCPEQVLADVRKIVGNDYATADLDKMLCYLVDESYPLIRPKETQNCILVRPACAKEVSKIPLQRKH
ncbi:MAG TPA: hypothetical protein DCY74_01920, partial [Clostridiales bacterium]|nr:hypothetical protein [Clostridiales bacterium]